MTLAGRARGCSVPRGLDAAGQFGHKAPVVKVHPSRSGLLQAAMMRRAAILRAAPLRAAPFCAALLPWAPLAALALFACGNADNTRSASVVPEWQQVADGLESSAQCCWSSEDLPTGEGAGAPEMHLPRIALSADDVIEVSFEADPAMTAEHWITTLYVRDQDAVVIGFRDFGQSALLPQFSRNEVPSLEFPAPLRTEWVRAYSYCNLHQHWVSDVLEL